MSETEPTKISPQPKFRYPKPTEAKMKSLVVKRSVVIGGHKTSVSLEDAFWQGLKEIAGNRHATLSSVVSDIDSAREEGNLSSAIRLFVFETVRTRTNGRDNTLAA